MGKWFEENRDKVLGSLLIVIISVSVIYFVYDKNNEIEHEQRLQVKTNQEMKEYVIASKDKEKEYEAQLLAKDEEINQVTEELIGEYEHDQEASALSYKLLQAKYKVLENELEEFYNIRNEEQRIGGNQFLGILDIKYEEVNELIQPENDFTLVGVQHIELEAISIVYDGYIGDMYIDKRLDGQWIYITYVSWLEKGEPLISICRYKEGSNDLSDSEIIYQSQMEDDRGTFFELIDDNELGCYINDTVIVIDLNSGNVQYKKVFDQYKEAVISNDSVNFYIDHERQLFINVDGKDKLLFKGVVEDEYYRGAPVYINAMSLTESPGGDYYSYNIGYYEGSSGHYIVDKKGNYVYIPTMYSEYGDLTWIDDHRFFATTWYGEEDSFLIDLQAHTSTNFDDMVYNISFDNENEIFAVGNPYYDGGLRVYKLDNIESHIELPNDLAHDSQFYKIDGNYIYICYKSTENISVYIYSYNFKSLEYNETTTNKIVDLAGYDYVSNQIFIKPGATSGLDNASFYYLTENYSELVPLNPTSNIENVFDFNNYDFEYESGSIIIDNQFIINSFSGEIVGTTELNELFGHRNLEVIGATFNNLNPNYLVKVQDGNDITISLVVEKGMKLEVADEFTISNSYYEAHNWLITTIDGNKILYDAVNDEGEIQVKYYNNLGAITEYIEGRSNPRFISQGDYISLQNNETDHNELYYDKDLRFETEYELKGLKYTNRMVAYYIKEIDGVRSCIFIYKDGSETEPLPIYDDEIIDIEDFGFLTRIRLISWMNNEEFEFKFIDVE